LIFDLGGTTLSCSLEERMKVGLGVSLLGRYTNES
jgi:hypothetical protein